MEITSAPREEAAPTTWTLASVRWEVAGGDVLSVRADEAHGRSGCLSYWAGGVFGGAGGDISSVRADEAHSTLSNWPGEHVTTDNGGETDKADKGWGKSTWTPKHKAHVNTTGRESCIKYNK